MLNYLFPDGYNRSAAWSNREQLDPLPSGQDAESPERKDAPRLLSPSVHGIRLRCFGISLMVNILIIAGMAVFPLIFYELLPPTLIPHHQWVDIFGARENFPAPGRSRLANLPPPSRRHPFMIPAFKPLQEMALEIPPQLQPTKMDIAALPRPVNSTPSPVAPPIQNLEPSSQPAAAIPAPVARPSWDSLQPTRASAGPVVGPGRRGRGADYDPRNLDPAPKHQAALKDSPPDLNAYTKPDISYMPRPEYPLAALQDKLEGDVIMEVTFDKSGHAFVKHFLHKLRDDMNSAAEETVGRIKFTPARRDGIPVSREAIITVAFRLTQLTLTASF